jgi:hypothetical protein
MGAALIDRQTDMTREVAINIRTYEAGAVWFPLRAWVYNVLVAKSYNRSSGLVRVPHVLN